MNKLKSLDDLQRANIHIKKLKIKLDEVIKNKNHVCEENKNLGNFNYNNYIDKFINYYNYIIYHICIYFILDNYSFFIILNIKIIY